MADFSEGQPTGRSGVTTAPPWPCPWGPWGWCQVGGHGTGRRSGIRLGSGPPLRLWAGLLARGTPLTHPWSRAADELELIRPSVYRNVARQLNLSLQSETVVTDAFLAVATQIFSAGEASCLGRGPTVPAGPGAWELSGPGLQHRWACPGTSLGPRAWAPRGVLGLPWPEVLAGGVCQATSWRCCSLGLLAVRCPLPGSWSGCCQAPGT